MRTDSLWAACALAGLLLAGCAPGTVGAGGDGDGDGDGGAAPNFGSYDAPFLWQPIDLDDSIDLGFEPAAIAEGERDEGGPITLSEVGDAVGIGESVASGNPHGVGVGFFDLDGDQLEDIFLTTGSGVLPQIYKNNGAGGFDDITASTGVGEILGTSDTYSIAAADYDSDGDVDVYVTAHPGDYLLRNEGDGTFSDATAAAGAGGPSSTQPGSASKIASWGDFNGDGQLDVAVASSTFDSGDRNGYLLQNQGDGTFADVTEAWAFHAAPTGNPCAVLWSDFDSDGDQDIWIWNDRGDAAANRVLLRNDGSGFSDITEAARLTEVVAGNPMGIDGADVDHDGHLDYYVSDIGGSPFLYNDANGTFRDIQEVTGARGDYGWGVGFEDLDADTWADVFLAQEDDMPYLTFRNLATSPPSFERQAWEHAPVGDGHNVAVAFADFDDNGTVDVVTAGTSGTRMSLFRNETDFGSKRYLEVVVSSRPETGELGGISGRVVVKTGDLVQFRDIVGGSSRASQNAHSVRFGLGHYTGADWVAVLWPDGSQAVLRNVEGNRVVDLAGAGE